MAQKTVHTPVLKESVFRYLKPSSNKNFIDCTVDGGGHALAILKETGPKGKLLGMDQDPEMIDRLFSIIKGTGIEGRLILACSNFSDLETVVKDKKFKDISGILFDLGMSSWHLEQSGRGFSFLRDEPLDMRYNPEPGKMCAADIVNQFPEQEIERILKEYGEESFARAISKEIKNQRKQKRIISSFELIDVIKRAVPIWYKRRRIHCATKTFQALRIATNSELENLRKALPVALNALKPQGRMVIISFHSLEDRIVKTFLKENHQKGLLKILTKKPCIAKDEEVRANPRSRSAKLRAATKI